MLVFEDTFDRPELDTSVWSPHYLPHWSSRAATAAQYELDGSCLRLVIPPEQGLWCADDHQPPLRVSGIQSGNYSGPVGSTVGQQPYRDGLVVREEQEAFWGWTPQFGRIELHARAELSPRSMVSLWMVGLEDRPERCAEICVMEVFGKALEPGSAAVGMGLHSFRDPAVPEDFEAVRLPIDVAEFHTYAVDWTAEQVSFSVDDEPVRRCARPPAYPMQLMLAVFDFPDWSTGADDHLVPSFTVDHIRCYRS
ncbi:glycoside hydrolase family 16 [Kribbella flavida DSM 17836]|uniref:Glycoside hydrolase family 16 n=1 Tax=Kribbella flavida (strain DSM 17836 / JCM 10339 / NBRC 14399) TaxID=479435 RepID=D2PT49_KRIFD|nr:glycoside hydrolase family 16 protein [Kribbella flavida]ADB29365.1 glycoside hydrolase family 16 [Kribbella flavida DSM 17836]